LSDGVAPNVQSGSLACPFSHGPGALDLMAFQESVVTKPLTDKELQTKLLELMRAGTLLIKNGSGVDKCPEHFLQNYCAAKLIEEGFIVTPEVSARDVSDWFKIPYDEGFFVDLIIWDRHPSNNPSKAKARAIVEFKVWASYVGSDVQRTARLMAKINDPTVFGLVVAGGWMSDPGTAKREGLGRVEGYEGVQHLAFDAIIPGYSDRQFGVVIGIPVKPAAALPAGA